MCTHLRQTTQSQAVSLRKQYCTCLSLVKQAQTEGVGMPVFPVQLKDFCLGVGRKTLICTESRWKWSLIAGNCHNLSLKQRVLDITLESIWMEFSDAFKWGSAHKLKKRIFIGFVSQWGEPDCRCDLKSGPPTGAQPQKRIAILPGTRQVCTLSFLMHRWHVNDYY